MGSATFGWQGPFSPMCCASSSKQALIASFSLKELLTLGSARRFTSAFVHSGTVSSWETVQWLVHQPLDALRFVRFQESDRHALRRFIHFVGTQGYGPTRPTLSGSLFAYRLSRGTGGNQRG